MGALNELHRARIGRTRRCGYGRADPLVPKTLPAPTGGHPIFGDRSRGVARVAHPSPWRLNPKTEPPLGRWRGTAGVGSDRRPRGGTKEKRQVGRRAGPAIGMSGAPRCGTVGRGTALRIPSLVPDRRGDDAVVVDCEAVPSHPSGAAARTNRRTLHRRPRCPCVPIAPLARNSRQRERRLRRTRTGRVRPDAPSFLLRGMAVHHRPAGGLSRNLPLLPGCDLGGVGPSLWRVLHPRTPRRSRARGRDLRQGNRG